MLGFLGVRVFWVLGFRVQVWDVRVSGFRFGVGFWV